MPSVVRRFPIRVRAHRTCDDAAHGDGVPERRGHRLLRSRLMDRRRATGVALVLVVGRRVRLRVAVRPAGLRGGRRLADAVGLAVPVRGRPRLVLAVAVGRPARRPARARPPGGRRGARAGRPVRRQLGHVLRRARDRLALAGRARSSIIYPVIVAVLSLRFGHRLSGRRPGSPWASRCVGVVLALGGIDPDETPAGVRPAPRVRLVLIYAVWIILAARLSGERREAGRGARRRRRAARRRRRSP